MSVGSCPDENVLLDHAVGVRGPTSDALEAHLDTCHACRAVVVALAKAAANTISSRERAERAARARIEHTRTTTAHAHDDTLAPGEVAPEPAQPLQPGERVDRYRIEAQLGAGAMGIVYAAHDPDLDRPVAVKVLRPREGGSAADQLEARLRREAKAIARVSDPHVVSVYDVGRHGAQLFVAMELVEGTTLGRWLRERPRTTAEVLGAMRQAGRGLAAAHAAGLVHRDFKPDNVLVATDGRIKVGDFGLARVVDGERSLATTAPSLGASLANLTRTGALLGTPAYMAPEQFAGGEVDPRSDQFAFCVVLWEALVGQRPFAGQTLGEISDSVQGGKIQAPGRRIPPWIRRVLARGLSPDREDRYPSMQALLEALDRDPRVRRRRVVAGVAALGLVGLAAFGVRRASGPAQCQGAERKLAGVWDAARRSALVGGLGKDRPWAQGSAEATARILDEHAVRWVKHHTESCEATRVRGEQSESLLDLSMQCLSGRLRELETAVDLLSSADDALARQAPEVAAALSPSAPCTDGKTLGARLAPPKDPALRPRIEALRGTLSKNRAQLLAGQWKQVIATGPGLVAEARALRYRPVEAEALDQLASAQIDAGELQTAEKTLGETVAAARAGGDDEVTADALVQLVHLVGYRQQRFAEGHKHAKEAWITLERMGGDARLESALRSNEAVVYGAEGKHAEAVRELEAALPLVERVAADYPNNLATVLANLGRERFAAGEPDKARPLLERALSVQEKAFGRDHPGIAITVEHLGNVLDALGQKQEGLGAHERALRLREAAFGPDHADTAVALSGVAYSLAGLGKHKEAAAANRRTLAILERRLGPEDLEVATTLVNLGEEERALGQGARARAAFERALAIMRKRLPPGHPNLGYPELNLGAEAFDRGALDEARRRYTTALALWERALGAEHPQLASVLVNLAGVMQRQGRAREALALGERARRIAERAGPAAAADLLDARQVVAEARIGAGSPKEALAELERVLAEREGKESAERTPGDTGQVKLALAEALLATRGDLGRARQLAADAARELGVVPSGAFDAARARKLLARLK